MAERPARGTFGPVVLLGLGAGALLAVAGSKTWAHVDGRSLDSGSGGFSSSLALSAESGKMPACSALALVVLASWGVVLVTRGRVRRGVSVLAILAALGAAATVVIGWSQVGAALRTDLASFGITDASTTHTGWFWAAAVGAVLSLLAGLLAVRLCPSWPEMGRRYDAPGDDTPPPVPIEDQTSIDLWKAMDEGRDPTA